MSKTVSHDSCQGVIMSNVGGAGRGTLLERIEFASVAEAAETRKVAETVT